ncbi:hypothetical protein PMIN06_003822 [Paraphaeosphaeria minitans]
MIPLPQGIRAVPAKTFFFAPFPGTQFDPPAAPAGPPPTHYRNTRSRSRPNAGSKYDVRAIYPASHPLRNPPTKNPPAEATEPSIHDCFVKARVSEDGQFLHSLWGKLTKKKESGKETEHSAKKKNTPSTADASLDAQTHPSPPAPPLQPIPTLFVLVLILLGPSSSALLTDLLLAGSLTCALLCAACTFLPSTLWARDGMLQVLRRAGRYRRSKAFWFCVVGAALVGDWVLSPGGWGEGGCGGNSGWVSEGRWEDGAGECFVGGGV